MVCTTTQPRGRDSDKNNQPCRLVRLLHNSHQRRSTRQRLPQTINHRCIILPSTDPTKMSFREIMGTSTGLTPQQAGIRSRTLPFVRALPAEDGPRTSSQRPTRIRRPIVLHGRVIHQEEDVDMGAPESRSVPQMSVRQQMERRSVFAQLQQETSQYQKTVAELEELLPIAGEQPDAAWRAKILMRSAQAVDQELWSKLYEYEKTLRNREQDPEVRQQQTACMKLHRDYKRAHKALVLGLTMYEKTQRAEISRLGAVGWSERQDEEDDFYTKTMKEREAEMEKMNKSMHKVKDVYKDLSFLVAKQQAPVDKLEEKNDEARVYTESARSSTWGDFLCFSNAGQDIDLPSCADMSLAAFPTASFNTVSSDDSPRGVKDLRSPDDSIKAADGSGWIMPLESIQAVHSDIVHFGKEISSEVLAQVSEKSK